MHLLRTSLDANAMFRTALTNARRAAAVAPGSRRPNQHKSFTFARFNATQQNDRRKSGWETSYSSTTTAEAEKRPGLRVKNTKATSYSNMSIGDVEKRLGFFLGSLNDKAISVEDMLVKFAHTAKAGPDDTLKTKEKVYQHLLEHIENERYPGEEGSEFKEANVHDLVHYAIGPILTDFRRRAGRDVRLRREKRIFSSDSTTGGYEDFVIMDEVSPMEENFVLVVEAKKTSLGRAVGQCLLAVKDMRDTNGGGKVYGFITTGEDWRMVVYDGSRFEMTEKFTILFQTMGKQRERWMRDYSALVDCMNVALSNGGIIGGNITGTGDPLSAAKALIKRLFTAARFFVS